MEEKEKNINEVDASQKKKKHKGITLLILILIIGGVGYLLINIYGLVRWIKFEKSNKKCI